MTERTSTRFGFFLFMIIMVRMIFVGFDDILDQSVADDVNICESDEGDAFDVA